MFLNKIETIQIFINVFNAHTFIARSASSLASLSLSMLIVSLGIERFGDGSAWRTTFGGDFERFDGDIR